MYKAIIFDVDGTILDTERAVLHSLQAVLAEEGGRITICTWNYWSRCGGTIKHSGSRESIG